MCFKATTRIAVKSLTSDKATAGEIPVNVLKNCESLENSSWDFKSGLWCSWFSQQPFIKQELCVNLSKAPLLLSDRDI